MEHAKCTLTCLIQKKISKLHELIETYYTTHLNNINTDTTIREEYNRLKEIYVLLYNEKTSIMNNQKKWQECIQLFIEFNNINDDIHNIENLEILTDLYERQYPIIDAINIQICNNCTYLDFYKKL